LSCKRSEACLFRTKLAKELWQTLKKQAYKEEYRESSLLDEEDFPS